MEYLKFKVLREIFNSVYYYDDLLKSLSMDRETLTKVLQELLSDSYVTFEFDKDCKVWFKITIKGCNFLKTYDLNGKIFNVGLATLNSFLKVCNKENDCGTCSIIKECSSFTNSGYMSYMLKLIEALGVSKLKITGVGFNA